MTKNQEKVLGFKIIKSFQDTVVTKTRQSDHVNKIKQIILFEQTTQMTLFTHEIKRKPKTSLDECYKIIKFQFLFLPH